ncbi:MAG TPA: division/cell wall cluster transcriptional repressor MraZ [Planctomycetaceae bacterium]|nr:division/cell wall cluster transcriptional repressor MraZ [Planctomycetaceae bacterium]
MALTGQFERSLDQKFRLAVPKSLLIEFADPPPDHLYVAKGYDHCLDLYSPEEFNLLAERLKERSSSQDEFRRYERLFFSSAERLSLDSQSRVRLPDRLVKEASLEREVMLVGVRNRAEVWDRNKWEEFQASIGENFDDVARNALN